VADAKRLADFKRKLVDQICEAAGGPCKYTGKDMKSAHKGMGITGDAFNYLVEDLATTLGKLKVGPNEQNELIGLLAPMKADIVEK
jgi:hemoglobin